MGKWDTTKITDVKDVKYRRYLQEVPGRLSSLSNSVNAKFIGKLRKLGGERNVAILEKHFKVTFFHRKFPSHSVVKLTDQYPSRNKE